MEFLGILSSISNHAAIYGFLILIACLGFVFLAGSGVDTHMLGLTTLPHARTTGFTLSLPVTRRRIVLTRTVMGLIVVIVVNLPFELFMWHFLRWKTSIFDLSISFMEVTFFGVCMYCLVTLLSTLVRGGLLFPLACTIVLACLVIVSGDWTPLALRIIRIGGSPIGTRIAIPWLPMAIYPVLSAVFLITAIKVVESRDY
jgi:hypothetical protein